MWGDQRHVLRGGFDAGEFLVTREDLHLFSRRHMQHVNALAGLFGQTQQTLGGHDRRFCVAHLWVAGPIALARKRLAVLQAILVFRMERRAAP